MTHYMKLIRFTWVFPFLFHILPAFSQPGLPDSCTSLVFHSALEEKVFSSFCQGGTSDYLALSLAIDPSSDGKNLEQVRTTLNVAADHIRLNTQKQKKASRKLKFIFDYVQQNFLKQYDLDAGFAGMFKTGNYNCLTASILYALLLDDLGIPYKIKLMPGHVYLIVYAEEVPYMFETTDPVTGFFAMDDQVRARAVQGLRLMSFIASDNSPVRNQSDIFDRYYIQLNNTDLRGLAGYEYVNSAVNEMIRQNYLLAYQLIDKACLLTPMSELSYLREQMLAQAIGKCGKTTRARAELLLRYYHSSSNPDKMNQVADEFKITTFQCLLSSFPAPDSLEPFYRILYNGIADESFRAVISDIYYIQYANYLRTQGNPEEFHTFSLSAYSTGNKSPFMKMVIQEYIGELFNVLPGNEEALHQIDSISRQYPVLMDFEEFRGITCYLIVSAAEDAFRMKNYKDGEKYLRLFEEKHAASPDSFRNCNPSSAYSLAGSYYFRSGNSSKAKAALKKGLSYDPGNWELKKKLSELGN